MVYNSLMFKSLFFAGSGNLKKCFRRVAFIACALFLATQALAANGSVVTQWAELFNLDQAIRLEYTSLKRSIQVEKDPALRASLESNASLLLVKMSVQDKSNQLELEQLLARNGWPTAGEVGVRGMNAIFLVVQHADLAFQEKYLPDLRKSAQKGDIRASSLALLEDRVLLGKGQPQIYGSQVDVTNGVTVKPVTDEEGLDARRRNIGMEPICSYLNRFKDTYGEVTYSKCKSAGNRGDVQK